MNLRNITPRHLRCSYGGCPAIYRKSDGTYVIVGKIVDNAVTTSLAGKVGADEYVVEISPEYLKETLVQTIALQQE